MRRTVSPLLINGFAAVLLVVALADAARLLGRSNETDPPPVPFEGGWTVRAPGAVPYDQIVGAHLYGRATERSEPQALDVVPTSLALRLLGVVNSTDRGQARALIAVQGAPARYFAVNQLIGGTDARIRDIAADQVIIERGDQLERVLLWSPENMARANEGARPPPLPGVAVPAFPDLGNGAAAPPPATPVPVLPGAARELSGAARDTP